MTVATLSFRHRLMPVFVVVVAIALFSTMDALMKRASIATGVYAALFVRSCMGVAVLGPVWRIATIRAARPTWPRSDILRLHALRGVLAAGMASTFFWGIVRTPLAEGIALSFASPLIALYLAVAQLGEKLRRESVVASIFGLAGVAVIGTARMTAEPHGGEAAWGIGAILVSAMLYAWNLVLQRKQAQLAGPLEVALFQNVFVGLSLLAFAPVLLLAGRTMPELLVPAPGSIWDIAGAAVLASGSLMLLAWAYARAEAQVLVPIEYTAFLWSALMGWLWFREEVTPATLAGVALIIAGVWHGARPGPEPQVPPA